MGGGSGGREEAGIFAGARSQASPVKRQPAVASEPVTSQNDAHGRADWIADENWSGGMRAEVCTVKVLATADIHQRRGKLDSLAAAVSKENPDVVALNGDTLDVGGTYQHQVSVAECAQRLANLAACDLVIVRGNHEDENWNQFLVAWPIKSRRLTLLHGSCFHHGPLVVLGFPCLLGDQVPFEDSIGTVVVETPPPLLDRPAEIDTWLPKIIHAHGPASRALWLMHEPPSGTPLSTPFGPVSGNPEWVGAIARFSPQLVLCGHDHVTPMKNRHWHCRIHDTLCVNVGQDDSDGLCFAVVEMTFPRRTACLPTKTVVRAYPWGESATLLPDPRL